MNVVNAAERRKNLNIKGCAPRFINTLPRTYRLDVGDREKIASYRAKAARKRRAERHVSIERNERSILDT